MEENKFTEDEVKFWNDINENYQNLFKDNELMNLEGANSAQKKMAIIYKKITKLVNYYGTTREIPENSEISGTN